MSEEGKDLLNLFKEVRIINKQIQLLLKTVDDKMKIKGWIAKDTVRTYSSPSINSPEKWFPWFLYRFYTNNDTKYKNILMYASVLLDDDIWGEYNLPEPLFTAGYFNYGKKEVTWNEWYAWWIFYTKNRMYDGTPSKSSKNWKDEWKKEWGTSFKDIADIQDWKCFGLPLTSITSQNVQSKVIDPMFNMLSKK